MKNFYKLKIWDFCAVAAVAAAFFFVWLATSDFSGAALTAKVGVGGKPYAAVALSGAPSETFVEAGGCVLEIQSGKIRFKSSNCADQVCVRTGWLTRAGQSAICAPNRVIVELDGGGGVDAVSK